MSSCVYTSDKGSFLHHHEYRVHTTLFVKKCPGNPSIYHFFHWKFSKVKFLWFFWKIWQIWSHFLVAGLFTAILEWCLYSLLWPSPETPKPQSNYEKISGQLQRRDIYKEPDQYSSRSSKTMAAQETVTDQRSLRRHDDQMWCFLNGILEQENAIRENEWNLNKM